MKVGGNPEEEEEEEKMNKLVINVVNGASQIAEWSKA